MRLGDIRAGLGAEPDLTMKLAHGRTVTGGFQARELYEELLPGTASDPGRPLFLPELPRLCAGKTAEAILGMMLVEAGIGSVSEPLTWWHRQSVRGLVIQAADRGVSLTMLATGLGYDTASFRAHAADVLGAVEAELVLEPLT